MKLSLRTRVLAATLVLVVVGLGVAGVATYGFLRSFLIHRMDQQLESPSAESAAEHVLNEQLQIGQSDQGGPARGLPIGTYVALLDSSGEILAHTTPGYPTSTAAPRLPLNLPGSTHAGRDQVIFTARDVNSDSSFRVTAIRVGIGPPSAPVPGTLVIAIPFSEIEGTVHRLVLVEALVSAGVLLGVGALGWWVVRVGLRPLDRMGQTAGAIAAGDLSRRVEPADSQTEVGRLGMALNTMLGRIEESFDRQRASEERLRQFVADASHELRTPLTSIRGYAELFRRGAADHPDDLERAMRRIEGEGARMSILVEDLLLLARLDQGRPLDRVPVDLAALVAEAVEDLRVADPECPVGVSASGPVIVSGDDLRLRQVVANILENAREHTPAGTPVTVRVAESDGLATIEVEDRGPGLSPEEAARVFERFYRGDPSRSRGSGGTGLGLSIAVAIVEAHGGHIAVATQPGHGATFTISIPVAPSPGAAEAPGVPVPPDGESRYPAPDVRA
jgi:two-component system OmpR family sensor kinase